LTSHAGQTGASEGTDVPRFLRGDRRVALNILGRARKMWRGWSPPEQAKPQYYSVACPEGHLLRGMRTEGYQALRCPECGQGIFVLPRSPLPDPPAPPAEHSRRRAPPTV